jgi:hypothetical protein
LLVSEGAGGEEEEAEAMEAVRCPLVRIESGEGEECIVVVVQLIACLCMRRD